MNPSRSSSDSSLDRIMASYKPKRVRLKPRPPPDPEYDDLMRRHDQLLAYCKTYNYSVSRVRVLRYQLRDFFAKRFARSPSHIFRNSMNTQTKAPSPLLSSMDLEEIQAHAEELRRHQEMAGRPEAMQIPTSASSSFPWDKNRNFVEEMPNLSEKETEEVWEDVPLDDSQHSLPLPKVQTDYFVYFFTSLKTLFVGDGSSKRRSTGDDEDRQGHIRFPEEVEKRAAERGDIMGKDRDVRRAKYFRPRRRKFKQKYDEKRNQEIADPELGDESEMVPDKGCFHKMIFGCGDQTDDSDRKQGKGKPGKFTPSYKRAVALFGSSIEFAGEFVEGNVITLEEAEKILTFPDGSAATEKLNYVAAQLWMFAFGIHDLFKADTDSIPTKSEFSTLIYNFGILAQVTGEITAKVYNYSKLHAQYSREWIKALKHIGGKHFPSLKLEAVVAKVPKAGGTLHLRKLSQTKEKEVAHLRITAKLNSETEETEQWSKFNNISKSDRLQTLSDLLDNCSDAVNSIGTQAKFFIEDMKICRFEAEDLPFLTRLYLLDDLLKYLARSKETTKEHRQNLVDCMTEFANDTRTLLQKGHEFIENVQEVNDMVQLCYEYMKCEYSIHLDIDMVETNKLLEVEKKPEAKPKIFSVKWFRQCCRRADKGREFHYKSGDFYRTDFVDAFKAQALSLPNVELILKPAGQQSKEDVSIRFADSDLKVDSSFSDEHEWTIERSSLVPKIERRMSMASKKSITGMVEEVPIKTILKRVDQPEGAIAPDAFEIKDEDQAKHQFLQLPAPRSPNRSFEGASKTEPPPTPKTRRMSVAWDTPKETPDKGKHCKEHANDSDRDHHHAKPEEKPKAGGHTDHDHHQAKPEKKPKPAHTETHDHKET